MSLYDQSQMFNAGALLQPVKTTYDAQGPIPYDQGPTIITCGKVKTLEVKAWGQQGNVNPPQTNDVIKSPNHYARGRFEVWDIIEFFKLNYNLGNVCKYILRAGVKTKNPLEDYKKARAYLDREIAILEGRIDVRPQ